jgi:hypothetical protein
MLLGCKGQFVPKIVDGTKPHSFRAKRKDGRKWKVGDTIQFFENVRQPNMRKIRPDGVVRGVQNVVMWLEYPDFKTYPSVSTTFHLMIDGRVLKSNEIEAIAIIDGFLKASDFVFFFFPKETKEKWEGQLVHWTDLKY